MISEIASKSTTQILEDTKKYVLISWSAQENLYPIVVSGGKGSHFWDSDGKIFLDFWSQSTVMNAGYGNRRIIEAIKEQLEVLPYASESSTTSVKAEYCKKVSELLPGDLCKTFMVTSGADAVENSIRIARSFTGKEKIISRYRSYHGATYGAGTLTSDARRPHIEPGITGVIRTFLPYCYRCPFGQSYPSCDVLCARKVEDIILYENPETIAAMIVETITGSNGIIIPPPEYFPMLSSILSKYGILLICDEILVGWGRTGKWFACQHFNLDPDILTTGKGAASGYVPLATVSISRSISTHFDHHILYSGSTFSGHPLAAAAGIGTIDAYKAENMIENSEELGKLLLEKLEEMKEKHSSVGDVRGLGLCAGIELVRDKVTKEPIIPWFTNHFIATEGIMTEIKKDCLKQGLLIPIRRNIIAIEPPLCITKEELLKGLEILDRSLLLADRDIGN